MGKQHLSPLFSSMPFWWQRLCSLPVGSSSSLDSWCHQKKSVRRSCPFGSACLTVTVYEKPEPAQPISFSLGELWAPFRGLKESYLLLVFRRHWLANWAQTFEGSEAHLSRFRENSAFADEFCNWDTDWKLASSISHFTSSDRFLSFHKSNLVWYLSVVTYKQNHRSK